MTLRHVVHWKLSGETRAERDVQAAEIIDVLMPLNGQVPGMQVLNVYRNELFDGENWDATLVADFDDAEALAGYQAHPGHVEAGVTIKKYSVTRAATDFTV